MQKQQNSYLCYPEAESRRNKKSESNCYKVQSATNMQLILSVVCIHNLKQDKIVCKLIFSKSNSTEKILQTKRKK